MRIQRIDLIHLAIPLKKTFETSFGVIQDRPALIIKMTTDDGLIGFGESSPLYVPISESETVKESLPILKQILPRILNASLGGKDDLKEILNFYSDFPVSKIGIEAAYFHLLSLQSGVSLSDFIGGRQRVIEVGESAGIKPSVAELIAEVKTFIDQGHKRVKIKIKPGHDLEIMRETRRNFPDLRLAADANAAYTADDVEYLAKLVELNLMFVEQPFKADDLSSHARLKNLGLPICLDESVKDLASCQLAMETGACDMINIKLARIGSLSESLRIHDYCLEKGVALFGGGRMETGLGKTINAHFYSLPGFTLPADLTPPLEYFEDDIISPPLLVENGEYKISERKGLGIEIDEEMVKKYTKEIFTFE
ncbi:MAG: o-succinylbenzoate synthase [Candidatus Magasanikbacteria bacterium]|nr:o-succinylbenzoate synthase [Candidatus Magasanikbacteria bacterium]